MKDQIVKIETTNSRCWFSLIIKKYKSANHLGVCYDIEFFGENVKQGNHSHIIRFYSKKEASAFVSLTKTIVNSCKPADMLSRKDFVKWYCNFLNKTKMTYYGINAYPWMDEITD